MPGQVSLDELRRRQTRSDQEARRRICGREADDTAPVEGPLASGGCSVPQTVVRVLDNVGSDARGEVVVDAGLYVGDG